MPLIGQNLGAYENPQGSLYVPNGNLPRVLTPVEDKQISQKIDLSHASPIVDPHRYAWVTSADFRGSVVAASGDLFLRAQNVLRNFLALRNASATANAYIEFGRQADANSTFVLLPGQLMLFDVVVPQDDLFVYFDGANGLLKYSFSTLGDRL